MVGKGIADMEAGEGANVPKPPPVMKCDGNHMWKQVSGKKPEDHISNLDKRLEHEKALKKKKFREQRRGVEFEKKAIEDNLNKMEIRMCNKEFECQNEGCEAKTEVDAVTDDRVIEAKSVNENQIAKVKPQIRNQLQVQEQLFDKRKKPLAKIDGSSKAGRTPKDAKASEDLYIRKGFEVEVVP